MMFFKQDADQPRAALKKPELKKGVCQSYEELFLEKFCERLARCGWITQLESNPPFERCLDAAPQRQQEKDLKASFRGPHWLSGPSRLVFRRQLY
jgi:hypothetical protein